MKIFESVGRRVCEMADSAASDLAFIGETFASAASLIVRPRSFRFSDCALAFERASFNALPVLLAIGLFRELGPLVTAIVLAGRTGSAFAAEIGTMKVDEELDALTTMGLPPVRFLVLPRVFAAILAMPVLTIFAELAGLIGGALVLKMMDVPTVVFWRHAASVTTVFSISFGLVKGALFGGLVGLIGCGAGMRTKSTADGVGVAATSAVVGGIVAIAVADGLLAYLCYLWNL